LRQVNQLRLSEGVFFYLAVGLPLVLPFVRRASPVFLVVAALMVVVHMVRKQIWRKSFERMTFAPIALGMLFLLWSGITCLWTPDSTRGWQSVASGTLIFACGLCLVMWPPKRSPGLDGLAAMALGSAALIVAIDLKTGGLLLHLIHSRPDPFRYNMVLVSLVVLSFGLFHDGLKFSRPMKYAAVALLSFGVFVGESETAKLALLVGYGVLCVSTFIAPIVSQVMFGICVLLSWIVFLLVPNHISMATWIFPSLAENGHAVERIQIWTAYSKMAIAGLPWGWGVETVAQVPMTSYYLSLPDTSRVDLNWLHPHNNVIQIASELGWIGIFLGIVSSFGLVKWAHANDGLRPARTGLVASVFVVALISHGFWQMWWWAAVCVALSFLTSKTELEKIVL